MLCCPRSSDVRLFHLGLLGTGADREKDKGKSEDNPHHLLIDIPNIGPVENNGGNVCSQAVRVLPDYKSGRKCLKFLEGNSTVVLVGL